jgi:zinc D-Ala-D-Ala dipeptidase
MPEHLFSLAPLAGRGLSRTACERRASRGPVGGDRLGICIRILVPALATLVAQAAFGADALPPGFARLRDIAPSIRQDIRYAGPFNFTGQVVPGYERGECIVWDRVARALARVQARLSTEGFALKVYDCYRPIRAVRAFVRWSRSQGNDTMKSVFYPGLDKGALFALGYIASQSRHSRGIAVDIGLVRADDGDDVPAQRSGRCDGPFEQRAAESSLDLGTTYDCMSERSTTASGSISAAARANRERLRRALADEGFHNYAREWWHYELRSASAPAAPYDFPIR